MKRRKIRLVAGFDATCPCCFRPGQPFCDTCEPEDTAQKLKGMRLLMQAYGIDGYIITSMDAHASEYIAQADERRSFLTGFTGSAGTALVTEDEAVLWTDGRYFLQAETQLKGTEWKLMKQYLPGVPEIEDWVLLNLSGKVIGVDPAMVSFETAQHWRKAWGTKVAIKNIQQNLVDAVWTARPKDPCNAVKVHPLKYAGEQVLDKLVRLRESLQEKEAEAIILSALDQIAWLFNLRGSDIACNPVFFAYAIVTTENSAASPCTGRAEDRAVLFLRTVDEGSAGLEDDTAEHLRSAGVEVKPYQRFFEDAAAIVKGKRVFLEPSSCSMAVMGLVPEDEQVHGPSPVEGFKAMKNESEMQGLRQASIRDSAAICEFFADIESRLNDLTAGPLDEVQAAQLMHDLRRGKELFVDDSFPTISSVGSNAAIIHYHPEPGTCKTLTRDEVYLCDTGGQYLDGTTDITRTLHFGSPTADEKRCYTRVLQGHVALASAVVPSETPGLMLDTFARMYLWQDGLAYMHGTGHGIGAYMNVHEGPMGIGGGNVSGATILGSEARTRRFLEGLQVGHFVSNEPGCYKDGQFGIRLEGDMLCVSAAPPNAMGNRPWVKFEYLTLVPFCRALIEVDLLAPDQLDWLNAYHARVREALGGKLMSAKAEEWLHRSTEPLDLSASKL